MLRQRAKKLADTSARLARSYSDEALKTPELIRITRLRAGAPRISDYDGIEIIAKPVQGEILSMLPV